MRLGLNLSTLNEAHDAFCVAIVAVWIIMARKTVAKQQAYGLVQLGSERTDKSFGNIIARLVTLAIDQFEQQAALGARQLANHRAVPAL